MIDHDTMARVLQDIWRWPPSVDPRVRKNGCVWCFSWDWIDGARALERIRYLSIHPQLIADLRRKTLLMCTNCELELFLRQMREQVVPFTKHELCAEFVSINLSDGGVLSWPKKQLKLKYTKLRDPEEAEDEESGLDSSESSV